MEENNSESVAPIIVQKKKKVEFKEITQTVDKPVVLFDADESEEEVKEEVRLHQKQNDLKQEKCDGCGKVDSFAHKAYEGTVVC